MTEPLNQQITGILQDYFSPIIAASILRLAMTRAKIDPNRLGAGESAILLKEMERGVNLYAADAFAGSECMDRLGSILLNGTAIKNRDLLSQKKIRIITEEDIVVARSEGRILCAELGFAFPMQIKLATAISELARNIIQYARNGEITMKEINQQGTTGIEVIAVDRGPGIENIHSILNGYYSSKTGLGKGLAGTKKIVDDFNIETSPQIGTTITLRMYNKT